MILNYLRQSYPRVGNPWRIIIPVSLFISLFMLVFQPFGLQELQTDYKVASLLGYGLVTFLILILDMLLVPFLFPGFFREKNWTIWKEILILLWILFSIGLGNLFYTSVIIQVHFSLLSVILFQAFTLAVGIIPVITLTIFKQNYLNRKHRISADLLTQQISSRGSLLPSSDAVSIASENGKEKLELNLQELIAIASDGNYITVFYIRNEKPAKMLLRNTMVHAEESVSRFPETFRCHRSYLVNMNHLSKVKGNSQGYRLLLTGMEEEVPVSRNNNGKLKQLLSA